MNTVSRVLSPRLLAIGVLATTCLASGAALAGKCANADRTWLGERIAVDTTVKNRTGSARFYVTITADTNSADSKVIQSGVASAGENVSKLKGQTTFVLATTSIQKVTLVPDGTSGATVIDGFSFQIEDGEEYSCTYRAKLGGSVTKWGQYSCTGTQKTFKVACNKSFNTDKGRWNTDFKVTDR